MRPHDYLDDEARDRAALYAMRALPAGEAEGFERHLSTCAACRAEVEELSRVTGALGLLGPSTEPPTDLRARVLDRIRGEERASTPARGIPLIAILPADQGAWLQTPFEGVELRVLHLDESSGRVTQLMRMVPGATFPRHRHDGPEECYVLQGDLLSGDALLRAGDYQRAEQNSIHGIQSTREGCLLLVVGSTLDELLDGSLT